MKWFTFVAAFLAVCSAVVAQTPTPEQYSSIEYRLLGPFRGGRSAAVTGVPGQPSTFYFGATGGGVWKTTDGGNTYENISDGYFGGSIGAVSVAESDLNVMYVGGGEKTVRGNVSSGYGVYKSVDGGKTWQFKGLPESRHIPRIRIHPSNPDVVYAAVLGNIYKPTPSVACTNQPTAARLGVRYCMSTTCPEQLTLLSIRLTHVCCMPQPGAYSVHLTV